MAGRPKGDAGVWLLVLCCAVLPMVRAKQGGSEVQEKHCQVNVSVIGVGEQRG